MASVFLDKIFLCKIIENGWEETLCFWKFSRILSSHILWRLGFKNELQFRET